MKQFLFWLGKKMLNATVTAVFFILAVLGIVYAAISYPNTPPAGEVTGGKFMGYFNKIFQTCPTGEVLQWFNFNSGKICTPVSWGGNTAALAAFMGAINSQKQLWDGTERCATISGMNATYTPTGCIRINNGAIETKLSNSYCGSTGWWVNKSFPATAGIFCSISISIRPQVTSVTDYLWGISYVTIPAGRVTYGAVSSAQYADVVW